MNLVKGQKADITKGRELSSVTIRLDWQAGPAPVEADGSVFLLSEQGGCERDEHLVFYGNPADPDGAVQYVKPEANAEAFEVTFAKVPAAIGRIAVALTLDAEQALVFGQVGGLRLRLLNPANGEEIAVFAFGDELERETAVVVGELYRHREEWKFSAVASGFNGGLAALCADYGLEVAGGEADDDAAAAGEAGGGADAAAGTAGAGSAEPAARSGAAGGPGAGNPPPAVSDAAGEGTPGGRAAAGARTPALPREVLRAGESLLVAAADKVTVTLEWSDPKHDLDLVCFYVTADGAADRVDCKRSGHGAGSAYVDIVGDSALTAAETVTLRRLGGLRHVLFAAYGGGAAAGGSFASMRARLTVDNGAGQSAVTPLYRNDPSAVWVAMMQLDFTVPGTMQVRHAETYASGGPGDGPKLRSDGTFKFD